MAQRVKKRNEKVFNDLQMVNSMINTENVSKTVFNWFNWCQEQNSTRSEPGTFKIWLNCAIVISIFFENIDFLLLFGIQVERQTIRFCTVKNPLRFGHSKLFTNSSFRSIKFAYENSPWEPFCVPRKKMRVKNETDKNMFMAKSKRFISYLFKRILNVWRASIVLLAIFPINF